ncbi:MAG: LysR substrate-binding domain-containing protein [Acidimicrobiales bacterium]
MSSGHGASGADGGVRNAGDGALRSFVAAARYGNFSIAASELGVTQSAISHGVARLERQVGMRLFERRSSGVVLTVAGAKLAEELRRGFDIVDRAVASAITAAATATARPSTVTLSVSSSFAAHWLLPRLGEFRRSLPGIDLRYLTHDNDRRVGRDGADIWIPLGSGEWSDLETHHFCDEEILLVAAPDLAGEWHDRPMQQLVHAPLLHLDERYPSRFTWARWFEHFGVAIDGPLGGDHSNDYAVVVQAAMAGQGIALGWSHVVADALDRGRLVQVGTERVRTERPLTLLVPPGTDPDGPIATVVAWLLEAVRGTVPYRGTFVP